MRRSEKDKPRERMEVDQKKREGDFSFSLFFLFSFPMSLKAALRAAHAALASGQLDEALERCQEAISLGESVDAYL